MISFYSNPNNNNNNQIIPYYNYKKRNKYTNHKISKFPNQLTYTTIPNSKINPPKSLSPYLFYNKKSKI